MASDQAMLAGLESYEERDYVKALKHFSQCFSSPSDLMEQTVVLITRGVINLQIGDYNDAGKDFIQARSQIAQLESQIQQNTSLTILKAKVLCNQLLLQLINCTDRTFLLLKELITLIQDSLEHDRRAGTALFRTILKSLLGFQSFTGMESEMNKLLRRVQEVQKNKDPIQSSPSPLLLSSFSIYCQLCGDLQQAYNLQLLSFRFAKGKQSVLAVLALRHLQELSRLLKDDQANKQHHHQLIRLMSTQELEGVNEQTLFRNYRKKFDLATKVVTSLIEQERQIGENDSPLGIEKIAVLWKLKQLQRNEPTSKIKTVLLLLQKNENILKIMGDSMFISDCIKQYQSGLNNMSNLLKLRIKKNAFKMLLQNNSNKSFEWSRQYSRNIQESNNRSRLISQSSQNSKNDHLLKSNSSKSRKQKEFATSFYLPKKKQREQSQQKNNPLQTEKRSHLTVHRQKNKSYLNNQSHYETSKQERPNNVYRIAKAEPNSRKVQQKRGFRTKSSNKMQSEISNIQKQILEKTNIMSQFIKTEEPINIQPIKIQTIKKQDSVIKIQEKMISKLKQQPVIQQKRQKQFESQLFIRKTTSQANEPIQSIIAKSKQTNIQHQQIERQLIESSKIKTQFNNKFSNLSNQQVSHLSNLSGSNNNIIPVSYAKEQMGNKLRKIITLCQYGQYIEKRHFTSDGGAQRFLKLSKGKDKLFWGQNQQAIDINNGTSYLMQDIRGIIYGKVTETMRKQVNHKLQPWKCFSLILKKRTFDVYCVEQKDLFFWIPGISLCLKDNIFQNQAYNIVAMKHTHRKKQKHACNRVVFGQREVTRYYSVGRILWKRFLMRLKSQYILVKKKEKHSGFQCGNAYAIIVAAVRRMGYKLQKMSRHVA